MRQLQFLFLALIFLTSGSLSAIDHRQRDYEAVQEFVNSKRTIPLADKMPYIKFSGSVRADVIRRQEKADGQNLRGPNKGFNWWDFDTEFNFKMDYKCGKTYGKLRLQSFNPMGVEAWIQPCSTDPQGLHGSGRCNDICLRDAWFGYKLCENDCYDVKFEVGRRRLYSLFDSRIQFNERFDGAVLRTTKHIGPRSDFYLYLSAFVVDFRVNHYSYAGETGVYNILDSNIDLKYSLIHWKKNGRNRCGTESPAGSQFLNSQFTAAYVFDPGLFFCERAKFYGAFEINTAAKKREITNNEKENIGWYIGFIAGDEDLRDAGDWAFDINYQYVQAQAVPDRDARGIKRGNVRRETLYADGRGNNNFKGMHIEFVYAFSPCFSIDTMYQFSHEIEKRIGGTHSYSKYEIDFIYSF